MKDYKDKKNESVPFILEDLQRAIVTLEKFSKEYPSFFSANNTSPQSNLIDMIKHMYTFVLNTLTGKKDSKLVEAQNKAKKELTEAIETLKNCYPLLEKYEYGNQEQKKIASLAMTTIKRFNESIDNDKTELHWTEKFALFFSKETPPLSHLTPKHKIDLPMGAMIRQQNDYSKKSNLSLGTLFNLVATKGAESRVKSDHSPPSKQASDMFKMKAIRLLREHKIPVKDENLEHSPIRVYRKGPDEEGHQIISLFQTLRPLPGEVIELKGNIRKNSECDSRPIPLPDSFHLATTAFQTGFPHPLQHTGWALANQLIPAYPHRQETLIHFTPVQTQMRDVALSLLPKGCNNSIAKELLSRKRAEFHLRKKTFLSLQKQLSLTILNASNDTEDIPFIHSLPAIDNFFSMVDELQNSYDFLAETNQTINETFIRHPYEKLQYIRLHDPLLQERVQKKGYHEIYEILTKEAEQAMSQLMSQQEKPKSALDVAAIDYILCMGNSMKKAFFFIMMQEKSEILGFPPPLFTCFTRKVQAATFKQLIQFNDEILKGDTTASNVEATLEERLIEDIALFEGETADNLGLLSNLVNELEEYYNLRYYSRSKNKNK